MSNEIAKKISFSELIHTKAYEKAIKNTLQDEKKAQRFMTSLITVVTNNPEIAKCEPSSIISAALYGESLHLSPLPQVSQYYLIPFKAKATETEQEKFIAQFVISYIGYIQLALRSGEYLKINAIAVKEGEVKYWNPLTEEIVFEPIQDINERNNKPTTGYVAFIRLRNGFEKYLYWSREQMIDYADRYVPAFSKNAKGGKYPKVSFEEYLKGNYPKKDEWKYSSNWYKDFDMMAYKTLIKQIIKKSGLVSDEMRDAIVMDDSTIEMKDDTFVVVDDIPDVEEPPVENTTSKDVLIGMTKDESVATDIQEIIGM